MSGSCPQIQPQFAFIQQELHMIKTLIQTMGVHKRSREALARIDAVRQKKGVLKYTSETHTNRNDGTQNGEPDPEETEATAKKD